MTRSAMMVAMLSRPMPEPNVMKNATIENLAAVPLTLMTKRTPGERRVI